MGRPHVDLDGVARSLRRTRLCGEDAPAVLGESVEAMIPHRRPMLLVDELKAFDAEQRTLRAASWLGADAPGFAGHFPAEPVYPGVLQIEMIGQAGLCLGWLLRKAEDGVSPAAIDARVLTIHHATFLAAVRPDHRVDIETKVLDEHALTGVLAGQIWCGETLSATCIVEVYFA
jgi:3-hydroxyacyl-[acyl-carrier-protein] dehydratase